MKHLFVILMTVLMSMSTSAFAGTTTSLVSNNKTEKVNVPANIVIRQSITFDDGKTIVVFYEKKGDDCRLYSKTDVSKYGASDLLRIKSTNFEKTDHVEGKCYATKTTKALIAMAKSFLK